MNKIEDMVAQAIGDPGSMVARLSDSESVTRWATRAVLEVLEVGVVGLGNSADLPETPAMRALAENAALRERVMFLFDKLRVANNLLHDANGVIFASENLKLKLVCSSSHCVEGDHAFDLDNPVPIGDQDWRDAARRWAVSWHSFMDADRPKSWHGLREGGVKPPLPPIEVTQNDLHDMVRAVGFGADLLRTELGPGGLMERESEALRANWALAIDSLEAAATVPMLPLFFWRERKAKETPAPRRVEIVKVTDAAVPGDCPNCGALDGTHTVRNCESAR